MAISTKRKISRFIKKQATICQMCKTPFKKGIYGIEPYHISRHHLFPKRFKNYFTKSEIQQIFNIDAYSTMGECCYECHEEVFHNIILNKKMIDDLSILLKGKSRKTKIVLFHQIFQEGIKTYAKNRKK